MFGKFLAFLRLVFLFGTPHLAWDLTRRHIELNHPESKAAVVNVSLDWCQRTTSRKSNPQRTEATVDVTIWTTM